MNFKYITKTFNISLKNEFKQIDEWLNHYGCESTKIVGYSRSGHYLIITIRIKII